MAEQKGFKYKVKSGDTEDSIIKDFNIPDWQVIYGYSENAGYRKMRPIPQKVQTGDMVVIPPEYLIPFVTGQKLAIIVKGMRILFDAHTHIESNNCSSLPIQWSIISKVAFDSINGLKRGRLPFTSTRANRKELAGINSRFLIGYLADMKAGRLIEIGRLPTDLIADLYMHTLKDDNLHKNDAWIVMKDKEYEAYMRQTAGAATGTPDQNQDNTTDAELGKRAMLSEMNADSLAKYKTFRNALKSYSGEETLFRMQCAQTFDLTFAHYWGRYGIPIYIPDKNGGVLFVNDYVQAGILSDADGIHNVKESDGISDSMFHTVVNSGVYIPRYKEKNLNGVIYHLYTKQILDKEFSFKKQFERFCRWQDSVLDPDDSIRPWFFMHFNGVRNTIEKMLNYEYVHLVEPVLPDHTDCVNEAKWVEDYFEEQLPLSEASAVKYPLNFLLFYHYDPRSHVLGDDAGKDGRISRLAENITQNHAFFTYRIEESKPETFKNDYDKKMRIKDRLVLSPAEELNTLDFWKKTIQPVIQSNGSVFSRLLQKSDNGIYWGIKMYPRFGYDPADFIRYPQLEELYYICSASKIPILSHCSEGGMVIADFYNYKRYDTYQTSAPDEYNLEHAARDVTNKIASPANWREVLKNYPDLKLNLAHFGSYCIWHDIKSFKDVDTLPLSNKAEEKAYRYQHWVGATGALIQDSKNVYTDLSCFTLTDDYFEQKQCADNLVFMLNKYPKLKERILLGTDWPLTETDPSSFDKLIGIGDYMNRMMVVLREVSKQTKYDAFHQFGYINQLRFLGLLDENGGEKKVKVEVLKDYRERLIKLGSTVTPKRKDSYINGNTNAIISKLTKDPKVPAAEDIKRNGTLAILGYDNYEIDIKHLDMGPKI